MQTTNRFSQKTTACILGLMIALASICPLTASATNSPIKTVKVGYFYFPGYQEMQDDGSVLRGSGYGNDFLQLLRRYANLNYEYVGYNETWETMPELLRSGEIDMYTLALKGEETTQEFAFSQPICSLTSASVLRYSSASI